MKKLNYCQIYECDIDKKFINLFMITDGRIIIIYIYQFTNGLQNAFFLNIRNNTNKYIELNNIIHYYSKITFLVIYIKVR